MAATGGAGSVRKLRAAIEHSVSAAASGDPAEFELAGQLLAAADQQRLRLVQGQIVRDLLEELHPGGLSGADAQDVLQRCVQAAIGWYPAVDAQVLVIALLGALNAAEPDDQPVTDERTVALHGSLLIADLIGATGDGSAQPAAELDRLLDSAFAEIQRAETIELP
ncbi:MAG: hypothetical protein ABI140_10235 [Jatrophihabitantaceae bacterium]